MEGGVGGRLVMPGAGAGVSDPVYLPLSQM